MKALNKQNKSNNASYLKDHLDLERKQQDANLNFHYVSDDDDNILIV